VSFELIIRSDAQHDLAENYRWHEERQLGLGLDFLHSVEAAFEFVSRRPKAAPKYYRKYHRKLIDRFPYGVFYLVCEDYISVVAVLPLMRSQRIIRRVLRGRI
jgi:hypothetical protein